MKKINKRLKKGFTLIEMLAVVTIIGIVSTILYTSYSKYVRIARSTAVKAELLSIIECLDAAMIQNYGSDRSEGVTISNFTTYAEFEELLKEHTITEICSKYTDEGFADDLDFTYDGELFTYVSKGYKVVYNIYDREFEID